MCPAEGPAELWYTGIMGDGGLLHNAPNCMESRDWNEKVESKVAGSDKHDIFISCVNADRA